MECPRVEADKASRKPRYRPLGDEIRQVAVSNGVSTPSGNRSIVRRCSHLGRRDAIEGDARQGKKRGLRLLDQAKTKSIKEVNPLRHRH
jgi:hypothetical protein